MRNRVICLLADNEYEQLAHLAHEQKLGLGTVAREIIRRALRRAERGTT